jgi:putative DNA primase/helicase
MSIDLRTGINRAPRREDYCTKIAAAAPAPEGTRCPMWTSFLQRVTNKNEELIGFLKRYAGYSLTGYVQEQVLLFLYGTGANGKGVFSSTIAGIMGDYSLVAPMEMFIESRFDRHPTEIARLLGARLVLAHETQKGRRWDEAKIKNLTGGDRLTGRFMRGDFFDFDPTHKLLISGNHKPSLRNVDEAVRRRFLLAPFTVQIPPAERDRDLVNKLKAEWPAILRWMVDGCLEWKRDGLKVPAVVRLATDEYLADEDTIGQWLDDYTVADANAFTPARPLFQSWKSWCEERNLTAGTEKGLVESLEGCGYERDRMKFGRGFRGIRLKVVDEPTLDLTPG